MFIFKLNYMFLQPIAKWPKLKYTATAYIWVIAWIYELMFISSVIICSFSPSQCKCGSQFTWQSQSCLAVSTDFKVTGRWRSTITTDESHLNCIRIFDRTAHQITSLLACTHWASALSKLTHQIQICGRVPEYQAPNQPRSKKAQKGRKPPTAQVPTCLQQSTCRQEPWFTVPK